MPERTRTNWRPAPAKNSNNRRRRSRGISRRKDLHVSIKNDDQTLIRRTVPGKLIRKPQVALDVEMNTLLINCRSLTTKLTSLSNNFSMNSATLAILTETWFSMGNKRIAHELNVLSQRDGISFLRKDRNTWGGGVAIAFNSAKMDLKKLPLK